MLSNDAIHLILEFLRHLPRFVDVFVRHTSHLRYPISDKRPLGVVIPALLDYRVCSDGVDSGSTGLHADLGPVYSRLIVQEMSSKM